MKTLQEVLKELHTNTKISPWEDPLKKIWGTMPLGKNIFTSELIEELNNSLVLKNELFLYDLLCISFRDGVNNQFINIITQLLRVSWHDSQEDLITMLDILKDPTTTDIIYETALNIPDYDDARSLAKKSIEALASINTSEAIEKLFLLTKIEDEIIREAACEQLGYLGYR